MHPRHSGWLFVVKNSRKKLFRSELCAQAKMDLTAYCWSPGVIHLVGFVFKPSNQICQLSSQRTPPFVPPYKNSSKIQCQTIRYQPLEDFYEAEVVLYFVLSVQCRTNSGMRVDSIDSDISNQRWDQLISNRCPVECNVFQRSWVLKAVEKE